MQLAGDWHSMTLAEDATIRHHDTCGGGACAERGLSSLQGEAACLMKARLRLMISRFSYVLVAPPCR